MLILGLRGPAKVITWPLILLGSSEGVQELPGLDLSSTRVQGLRKTLHDCYCP